VAADREEEQQDGVHRYRTAAGFDRRRVERLPGLIEEIEELAKPTKREAVIRRRAALAFRKPQFWHTSRYFSPAAQPIRHIGKAKIAALPGAGAFLRWTSLQYVFAPTKNHRFLNVSALYF
jgi:hypothetical protein